MVELRLLLLWLVIHHACLLRLCEDWLSLLLPIQGFLVLLSDIARSAAASTEAVSTRIALKLVLRSDITAIDHGQDKVKPNTGEATKCGTVVIAARVAVHVAMIRGAMSSTAIHDARTPPG